MKRFLLAVAMLAPAGCATGEVKGLGGTPIKRRSNGQRDSISTSANAARAA
jgi:hypothetical protein